MNKKHHTDVIFSVGALLYTVFKICHYLASPSYIRQRGDVGGSSKKVGLKIKELERLYEIQNGSTAFQGNQYEKVDTNNSEAPKITQEQLAEKLGMSVDTLQNYKLLAAITKRYIPTKKHHTDYYFCRCFNVF